MKNTVIFDLDGTVLDTLADLFLSVNATLSRFGCPLRTMREVRGFVGNGIKNLVIRSLPPNSEPQTAESALKYFMQVYEAKKEENTKPYEGVVQVLQKLKALGFKTAVVSNKRDDAVQKLVQKFFNGLFDFSFGERAGVPLKPAPDSTLEALKLLNASNTAALYVGDSDVDFETARNAGIDFIAVSWGFKDKDVLINLGAPVIADTPDELFDIIYRQK